MHKPPTRWWRHGGDHGTGGASAAGIVVQAAAPPGGQGRVFDSMSSPVQAARSVDDANADEIRYWWTRRGPGSTAGVEKVTAMVQMPGAGIFQYDAALAGAMSAYRPRHADVRSRFFGVEFRNSHFAGERAGGEGH